MNTWNLKPYLLLLVSLFMLGACGGGGSSSPKFGVGESEGGSSSGSTGGSTGGTGSSGSSVVKIGTGTGTAFVLGALATTKTTLQSGSSTTLSFNVVDGNNAPVLNSYTARFSSTCLAAGSAQLSKNGAVVSQVTTADGLGSVNYTPQGCSGTDTVTASLTVGDATLTATVALTIEVDQVLAVEFVSASKTQLSLRGIGGQETATVIFKLVGAQSAPIIGESVTFTLSTLEGGVSLAGGSSTGITDSQGLVSTVVQSGTTATTVKVFATHDATLIQGGSTDISISTGVAVDDRFSISMSSRQPANAFNTDGIEVSLNVIAADQFGNSPPNGTQVRFVSAEAGKVDSACSLVDGRCSVKWLSSGPRPADLRVQVLAYMRGAETFVDVNGNSVYDSAEIGLHTDLGEPFADENESGAYDLGEFFVDIDQDGVYDLSGDGEWNGPCMSGVNAAAICSTKDSTFIFRDIRIFMPLNDVRIVNQGNFPALGGSINVGGGTVTLTGLVMDDGNGNPWPTGTKYTWSSKETNSTNLRLSATSGEVKTIYPANSIAMSPMTVSLTGNAANVTPATTEVKLEIVFPDNTKFEYYFFVNYNQP